MIHIEVCINCDSHQTVTDAVTAAFAGGASRIELCGAMQFDGLTPKPQQITEARKAFRNRPGLMVMIRPRKGNFYFSKQEISLMKQHITTAAELGANGVVLGVLQKKNNCVARDALLELMDLCQKYSLHTTFHRAFDATPDPLEALDSLLDAGVKRVLTSGTKWSARLPSTKGIANLRCYIETAQNRIEIIVGGGVTAQNMGHILTELPIRNRLISVHAYSGAQQNGIVTRAAIKNLVDAALPFKDSS